MQQRAQFEDISEDAIIMDDVDKKQWAHYYTGTSTSSLKITSMVHYNKIVILRQDYMYDHPVRFYH